MVSLIETLLDRKKIVRDDEEEDVTNEGTDANVEGEVGGGNHGGAIAADSLQPYLGSSHKGRWRHEGDFGADEDGEQYIADEPEQFRTPRQGRTGVGAVSRFALANRIPTNDCSPSS